MNSKTLRFCIWIVFVLTIASPGVVYAWPSNPTAGADYIEVFDGDMPLLFVVGHGGWKVVGEQENGTSSADPLLRAYFYQVLTVHIYERTGHLPYIVYQQGNRNYVNTNRSVGNPEAYHPDNAEARAAYFAFHDQVDAVIARMEARYGEDMALLVNPHTTYLSASRCGLPWDRIVEIGIAAPVTGLDQTRNTMKALYDRRGEGALRGKDSVPYQFFHGLDWPTPDAVWPAAATVNSKTLARNGADVWHVLPAWVTDWNTDNWITACFNGGSTIRYHGTNTIGHHSNWSKGLDAFQLEVNYLSESGIGLSPAAPGYDPDGPYYQLDMAFTTPLMDGFIDAILYSLQINYDWTPGDAYNVIVDNGAAGFSTTGVWEGSPDQGFWGTPGIYADAMGATAMWTPNLAQSGIYEVLVRWVGFQDHTDAAQYTVNSVDGSHALTLDQSLVQNDARWISLGTFPFAAGMEGNVSLMWPASEGTLAADAVLFRLISPVAAPMQKTVDTGELTPVALGSVVTYTLAFANAGDSVVTDVHITDGLPAGVTFGEWVGHGGSAILPPPTISLSPTTLLWTPGDIAPHITYTLTFTVVVTNDNSFAGATITNIASFTATNLAAGQSNPASFTVARFTNAHFAYLPLILRNSH